MHSNSFSVLFLIIYKLSLEVNECSFKQIKKFVEHRVIIVQKQVIPSKFCFYYFYDNNYTFGDIPR